MTDAWSTARPPSRREAYGMSAPIPPTEGVRIRALCRYHILNIPPERHLDGLTCLAAQLCRTPVAVISLLGNLLGKLGINFQETPR